jgi:hypothetical protein
MGECLPEVQAGLNEEEKKKAGGVPALVYYFIEKFSSYLLADFQ